MSAGRGRRPGSPDTRAEILTAAREAFATAGFKATSVRAIAATVGVDAALVHHYFGTKEDLFAATAELPLDPGEVLLPALAGDRADAGARLVRAFLGIWDDPGMRLPLLAFVRRALDPEGAALAREVLSKRILEPVGAALGIDEPERRMPLAASQLGGLLLMRYVLALEPVASMPAEELVAVYGPTLQRYLDGPLPSGLEEG